MKATNFNRYFLQPYPYYYKQGRLHEVGLLIIFLCFFFNYFFEPFKVYVPEHKVSFLWICVVHAVIPALIGYSYFTAVNYFTREDDNWDIGKEILHLSIVLLLIGTGNFLIRDFIYDNPGNWTFQYYWEEVRNAFLVGTLFTAILVPMNFNRLFRKYHQEALVINASYKKQGLGKELSDHIHIQTQVRIDDFNLEVTKFLYAKAAGNYVEIILKEQGGTTKLLKRITIKELEKQLGPYPWITKTHRAYLVNTRKIYDIKGNAQGYQITFEDFPEKVPVSRGMVADFNQLVKKGV